MRPFLTWNEFTEKLTKEDNAYNLNETAFLIKDVYGENKANDFLKALSSKFIFSKSFVLGVKEEDLKNYFLYTLQVAYCVKIDNEYWYFDTASDIYETLQEIFLLADNDERFTYINEDILDDIYSQSLSLINIRGEHLLTIEEDYCEYDSYVDIFAVFCDKDIKPADVILSEMTAYLDLD